MSTSKSRVEGVCTVPCLALDMGRGLSPTQGVSLEYPEEEEKGTGANRLKCPSISAGPEVRGTAQAAASLPGELVLPPGTIHSLE